MPNTKDQTGEKNHRILLVGGAGAGKTTQAWTLPGKKFAYIFDPNSVASLEGLDMEYMAFQPDIQDLDLTIKTLKKGIGDSPSGGRRPIPNTYLNWEKDFEERLESKYFTDYNWIIFDSLTTFSDMVMDRVLHLNGRLGKQPEIADYGAQMQAIQNVFRVFLNMDINIMAIAHTEIRHDEVTHKTYGHLMVTGRLRARLPLLFTNIWPCYCGSDEKTEFFGIQTRPDSLNPVVRTTIKGLDMYEEVTISDWSNAETQGIGAIISRKE